MVGFVDPSSLNDTPGWPLRNLLYLLNKAFQVKKIKILCYRGTKISSLILETELPETSSYQGNVIFILGLFLLIYLFV